MPHQCTKCGKIFPDASNELLIGCKCGSKFFYYIRQEKLDQLELAKNQVLDELEKADKDQIEKDIRELTGLDKKPDEAVILDLESIRVIKPGKFEIDIVNLFKKNQPLIYKLEEGKYIIDLASSLGSYDKTKTNEPDQDFLEIEDKEEEPEKDKTENVNNKEKNKKETSEDKILDLTK